MAEKQVVFRPGGTQVKVLDTTANDSDKTYTVPTGKVREYSHIGAHLACTATVGTRFLAIRVYNAANELLWNANVVSATASQLCTAISESNATYGTAIRLVTTTSPNASVTCNLPYMRLGPGDYIRILDSAAIDAAADDLTVVLHYIEYEA